MMVELSALGLKIAQAIAPKLAETGFKIDRWYDSRVRDPAEAQRRKSSIKKAISENKRIKLLASNPLLLTIIALIHRYQALLPRERYKLYEKAVETLLKNWDANKEITAEQPKFKYLDADDLRRLMEILAYWIHTQGNTEVQWLDRHQDSAYIGYGIDALWDLVAG